MENFPLADTDSGVTTLVSLVAVMTSEVLHRAVDRDADFIDGKEAKAFAVEVLVRFWACVSACFGETVFT